MHLSLKSGLGKLQLFLSRVLSGRVLDLFGSFTQDNTTVSDTSGEGNDATLYTGRYISTDGSTDRGIVADCSAAGAGSYYLTGKVRPNAVTTAELTMDGSTDSGLTGLTADVWQTFTTATSAVTPSAVQVGYDGSTASAADWSDVKLIDSSDGSTVARWQLNESAAGDLNGYPALDSVGGYHGTHTGCAGGTGEGINSDVVGAAYEANESQLWFTGSGVTVPSFIPFDFATAFTLEWEMLLDNSTGVAYIFASNHASGALFGSLYTHSVNNKINLFLGGTNDLVNACSWSTVPRGTGLRTYKFEWDGVDTATLTVDGVNLGSRTLSAPALVASTWDLQGLTVGFYKDIKYDGVLLADGAGTDASNWNGVTPTGNPITVGQKRATILQTAGMDWNKLPYFSGDGTESVTFTPITFSGDIDITLDTYIVSLSGSSGAIDGGHFLSDTSGSARFYYDDSGGKFSVADDSNASASWNNPSDISITAGVFYNVRLQRTSGTWNLTVNGADQGAPNTGTANGNVTFNSWAAKRGTATSITALNGVIYNIDLGTAAWGGVSPFADTIGSNDGTVNGSPSNYLIPASDSTAGEDALGNAIAIPRPTSDTWNLFGDAEYGLVADADSLDVTTQATWEIWGNFYGQPPNSYFVLGKASGASSVDWGFQNNSTAVVDRIRFYFNAYSIFTQYQNVPDAVTHICLTYSSGAVACYFNGVLQSPQAIVGVIPASLNTSTSNVLIGFDPITSNTGDDQISRPKIYNRAFTADEVLQNFNAQKSSFGL